MPHRCSIVVLLHICWNNITTDAFHFLRGLRIFFAFSRYDLEHSTRSNNQRNARSTYKNFGNFHLRYDDKPDMPVASQPTMPISDHATSSMNMMVPYHQHGYHWHPGYGFFPAIRQVFQMIPLWKEARKVLFVPGMHCISGPKDQQNLKDFTAVDLDIIVGITIITTTIDPIIVLLGQVITDTTADTFLVAMVLESLSEDAEGDIQA